MRNLTIKFRLCFAMGFLALLLAATGTAGLLGLKGNNDIFRAVYDDRLVALGQLDNVIRAILRNQIELNNATNEDVAHIPAHLKAIEENLKLADAEWTAYTGSHIVPQEAELFGKFVEARRQYHEQGFAPALKRLQEKDLPGARALASGPVYDLYKTLRAIMNDLIQMQLDLGRDEYVKAQSNYETFKSFALLAITTGLLMAAGMGIWLIRSISFPLQEAVRIANAITAGDLTQHIEVRSKDETGKLLTALKEMHGSLKNIVGQVRTGTDTIATATGEIATGNLDLSLRTEQQASSLEKTASAMEELTSTVKQNSDNARQANQLVLSASDVASKGGAVVTQVMATMTSIDEAAKKIVNIIAVIDSIAFQTNILALNAAVEAARAGAQGRGFAVVATEVRNLARRSAEAAREIKILINDTVQRVGQGNELVQQAGSTMDEILSSVKRVTAIMGDIAAASDEQDSGIGQISLAVVEIDSSTQQNAALVEQAAAAAASLKEQAFALAQVVSVFKLSGQSAPVILMQAEKPLPVSAPMMSAQNILRVPGALPDKASAPEPAKPATLVQHKRTDAEEQWEEF